jgi:hypothetical protein
METDRTEQILLSLQKMAILAECLLMENCSELLGAKFGIPIINNFAKRIGKDIEAIQKHLEKSGRYGVRMTEVTEEYSSEMWRVVTLLNGLPVENIKQFADGLQKEFELIGL